MNVPVMINCFIYTRMIGETPKWVQNFAFIILIIGKKQIKDMGYTEEQLGIIVGLMFIGLVVLIVIGKHYVDKIIKKEK